MRASFFFSHILVVFWLVGCVRTTSVFDKERFISECCLSIEEMIIPDSVVDSLLTLAKQDDSLNLFSDEIDGYLIGNDAKSTLDLYNSLILQASYRNSKPIYIILIKHLLAKCLTSTDDPTVIIKLVLDYASVAPFEDKLKIGENAYSYSRYLDDSLAIEGIYNIISGLYGIDRIRSISSNLDSIVLTKDAAKKVIHWCKVGLPYESATFGNKASRLDSLSMLNLLYAMAVAGYCAKDKNAGVYADSLINRILRIDHNQFIGSPDLRFSGPVKKRFDDCLSEGNYDRAEGIIGHYLSDYQFSPEIPGWDTLYPHVLYEYVNERKSPDDELNLLGNGYKWKYSTIRFLSSVLNEVNKQTGEIVNNTTLCCFEKARLSFLKGDGLYSDWLTNVFFRGIDDSFPSMTDWCYVDELLSPFHQYNHDLIGLMRFQYNNEDPCMVYDAILYIKGASNRIPIEVYKKVKETCPSNVVEYADSIRRFGIDHWNHMEERDYLEKTIGISLKDILSESLTSWKEIRDCLESNEVAIEFFCCPSLSDISCNRYKAAIIKPDSPLPVIIELCDEKQLIGFIKKGRVFESRFFDLLWQPILEQIGDRDMIYYSTDGFLDVCNLQSVMMPDGSRLMDIYKMRLLSSTREILDIKEQVLPTSITLFGGLDYGSSFDSTEDHGHHYNTFNGVLDRSICRGSFDYLPYSKEEVCAISLIAKEYGIDHNLFMDGQGTEEAFISLSGCPSSVLHIATHGFYYSSPESSSIAFFTSDSTVNPLSRCGLMLSRGQHVWVGDDIPQDVEDGVLLGSEICKLDFHNIDLVVLSACSTALGDFSPEGVSGLRQAFKRAGAGSIIMTLGKVDDKATAYFMSQFYNAYFSSCNKHEAFLHAIEAMRMSNDFNSPRIWGNYILID